MPRYKHTDSKGRVTLGEKFANKTVIIREVDETEISVTLARILPEREAWLFENPEARARVLQGLEQAQAGQLSESPPDLDAASKLAEQLEDE